MTKTELEGILVAMPDDAHSIIIKGRFSTEVFFTSKLRSPAARVAISTPGWGPVNPGEHRWALYVGAELAFDEKEKS